MSPETPPHYKYHNQQQQQQITPRESVKSSPNSPAMDPR